MSKTKDMIYVTFLPDVACQKLLKSANVSWSYSKNNTGAVFSDTVYIGYLLLGVKFATDSLAYVSVF